MSILKAYLAVHCLLFALETEGFALKVRRDASDNSVSSHSHAVSLNSLLPHTTCTTTSSVQGPNTGISLPLAHKHGPCSVLVQDNSNLPKYTRILDNEKSRVQSIQKNIERAASLSDRKDGKYGTAIGEGNYIVNVGLGTPQQDLSLILDTGSSLSWTSCDSPELNPTLQRKEKTFNPIRSTSLDCIACNSSFCSQLQSDLGIIWPRNCYGSPNCQYSAFYHSERSFTGFTCNERLALTYYEVWDDFVFGCANTKVDVLGGASGILGLGPNSVSFLRQTTEKYQQIFSYCIPSTSSYTGFVNFGYRSTDAPLKYTPLVMRASAYYGLHMVGISVGGYKLLIATRVFRKVGTVIDSGTEITRLPSEIYFAMRDEFRKRMEKYPRGEDVYVFDTCYDLSSYESVTIPTISFHFKGGVEMNIHPNGILNIESASQVCLAFSENEAENDTTIIGNMQQKKIEVVFDTRRKMVGFRPNMCN